MVSGDLVTSQPTRVVFSVECVVKCNLYLSYNKYFVFHLFVGFGVQSQNIPQKGRIKYTDYKDDLYMLQPKNCFAAIVTELVS